MQLQSAPPLLHNSLIHIGFMPNGNEINSQIMDDYMHLREEDLLKRTHFFGGRYENLYLERQRIPAIGLILQQAEQYASQLLQMPVEKLRSGFWINDMGPGESTTEHDHDENDELLSGVYYVKVPENSGNLVIIDTYSKTELASEEGMFVFFAPSVLHSVTRNNSDSRRISIGMNFGPN